MVVKFKLMVIKFYCGIFGGCDIVVVIDVGYGGEDFGVIGVKGICEKDVVL